MNSSIGRVKGRPYGHPLFIKPPVRISRMRLSFGIVPLQVMEPFNSSTGRDHSQPCQRRPCQHSLFCSGFQCDWECRPSLSPPLVPFRSRLRLPILRSSARYLAVPHCSLSSTGSRPGRGDFSQQWDMIFFISNVLFVYLSLLCFKARQLLRTEVRGIIRMLSFYTTIVFQVFIFSMRPKTIKINSNIKESSFYFPVFHSM